jgi:hypothetical protein
MINIEAGGFYTYNYQAIIYFFSFQLKPDKDKEIDTAAIYKMYVILYFIKRKERE